jgi:LPXTG-motif cell wall-anchored protein
MMTVWAMIALTLMVVGGVAAAPLHDGNGTMLMARLSGANEVPDPGDPNGTGMAMVSVQENGQVCFDIKVSNLTLPVAAAHIHKGAAGVAGPVVVPFITQPDADGMFSGCVTVEDQALVQDIAANPAGYYVNVHTPDYPKGAIRGQLAMSSSSLPDTGARDTAPLLLVSAALVALFAGIGVRRRVRA